MKICMLGDARSPHLQHMACGLAARGFSIHVITNQPAEIERVQVEKFTVPPFSWRYPGRWRTRWSHYLRRLMDEHDLVQVHFLHDWGITPQIAEAGNLVVTPWGSDIVQPPDTAEPAAELRESRREMLRCAKFITAWGPSFAASVAKFADIEVSRVELIPLSVDAEQFAPRDTLHRSTLVIGYFKGFAPVYGPMIMVEAAALVAKRRPNVRFEFVGDGALQDACRKRVVELGIDDAVRWLDRQPHENLPDIMAGWDLVAISSRRESFGLAALEASAMQLPVVASDVGGLHETVHHETTGLLVRPEDPESLAEALLSLLSDPQRRREMGRRGRRMVLERFERDRILDLWAELYTKAVRSVRHPEMAALSTA